MELTRAAQDLGAEVHEDRLLSYLRIFGKRRFPIDPAALPPLAHHPNKKLVAAAFAALSHLTDHRISALALDTLEVSADTGFAKGWALSLLIGNYQPEDAVRLAGWFATSSDRDEFHSIGFGMLDLLEAHPTTEGVPALLALYESGPCSNCRCRAVELLHTLDTMRAWILKEAPFDASADIRQKLTEWATPA